MKNKLEMVAGAWLVIGAGYIGVESAQLFARLDVKVTIISRRGLLPKAEPEISKALTQYFQDEGITVLSDIIYDHIQEKDGCIILAVKGQKGIKEITAEKVLVATGRTPHGPLNLNLGIMGIALTENNGVKTVTEESKYRVLINEFDIRQSLIF